MRHGEPSLFRQRFVTDSDIGRARLALSSENTPERQLELLFEHYLEARLRGYSWVFKRMSRRVLTQRFEDVSAKFLLEGNLSTRRDLDLFSYLVPVSHGILFTKIHPRLRYSLTYFNLLAHEFEHYIQANDTRYYRHASISESDHRYYGEFGAVLSEYNLSSMAPPELLRREAELLSSFESPTAQELLLQLQRVSSGFAEYHAHHWYNSPASCDEVYLEHHTLQRAGR